MKFIFKKIAYFIFSSTLLVSACAALTAKASCREAFAPELPNPYTANEFEMRATLSAVKGYLEGQKIYLDCEKNNHLYQQAIDRMYKLIDTYNRVDMRYKERKESADLFTEIV